MINNNNIVDLDLILRDNKTKELLDTTFIDLAKKENLATTKKEFKSLKFIYGQGELLEGVEKQIKDLKEGESKTFTLKKENAFGDRDPKKTQIVPLAEFKKQNITPKVGMQINLENKPARIISVSGGRVKVDLNPLFAGRDLDYEVTINKIFTEDKDKVPALIEKVFYYIPRNLIKYIIDNKDLEIILPTQLPKEFEYFKYAFTQLVMSTCEFENIKYTQIYNREEILKNKR